MYVYEVVCVFGRVFSIAFDKLFVSARNQLAKQSKMGFQTSSSSGVLDWPWGDLSIEEALSAPDKSVICI